MYWRDRGASYKVELQSINDEIISNYINVSKNLNFASILHTVAASLILHV